MSKLRVNCFGVSIDGFGAGVEQSLQNPLGVKGLELMQWFFPTDTFQRIHGAGQGTKGIDEQFAARGFDNMGAWILGRNMFGPIRGDWPDDQWRGWWGDNPPYHVPVFVLTHYPRADLVMQGGTTFHFVTSGIHEALHRARDAANGRDIRLGGGVSTVRQYLQAGLIDEMHLALSPVVLGRGERLLEGIDLPQLGYQITERVTGEGATHVVFAKNSV